MEENATKLTKPIQSNFNTNKILVIILVISVILGTTTGYILNTKSPSKIKSNGQNGSQPPKSAGQDTRTFRDFAEGTIKAKPAPKDPTQYSEGTHFLERTGAVPVALTSSVVDLSLYEGKKVKVYGETQKALKEGWLMDVGKVEEIK